MTLALGLIETLHSILIYCASQHLPGRMTQAARQPKPAAKPSLALDLTQK